VLIAKKTNEIKKLKEVIVVSKKEKFNFENLNMMSFKKGMEKKMG